MFHPPLGPTGSTHIVNFTVQRRRDYYQICFIHPQDLQVVYIQFIQQTVLYSGEEITIRYVSSSLWTYRQYIYIELYCTAEKRLLPNMFQPPLGPTVSTHIVHTVNYTVQRRRNYYQICFINPWNIILYKYFKRRRKDIENLHKDIRFIIIFCLNHLFIFFLIMTMNNMYNLI